MTKAIPALLLTGKDNVATLLEDVGIGEEINIIDENNNKLHSLLAQEAIKTGHKVALEEIPEGTHIKKYGEVIGVAKAPILQGMWVHVHNLESTRGRGDKFEKHSEN